MVLGDPLLVVIQVFVHVDKPAVFQADPLGVHYVYKVGVLADGAHGADKHGGFAFFVLFLDNIRHLPGNGLEYGGLIVHDDHGDFGIAEEPRLVVVIVLVMHTVFLSFSVILKSG